MEDKAKKLHNEHLTEYTFYSKGHKNGFAQRLKNLAGKINVNGCEIQAVMYLDTIALRLDIDLNPYWKE